MFDDTDTDLDWNPNDGSARNIWKRLDLLMSFAESQTSEAHHDAPGSLLRALNYLWELEWQVQTELDLAVIALKEYWRNSYSDIAATLGTKWEHDRSHQLIPLLENELNIGWREAQKRYRDALKRQFGPDTEVPAQQYYEDFEEDIYWRRRVMNPDGPPPPPKPEKDPEQERSTAISNRMQRVVVRLRRRGNFPNGLGIGFRPFVEGLSGIIVFTLTDGSGTTVGEFPIPEPDDTKHPFRGIEEIAAQVEKAAHEVAAEIGLDSGS